MAMLVSAAALVMVPLLATQAGAVLSLANPPTFNTTVDENGADDQPGQKDLSLQGVGSNGPGDLWTMWQWDVTSLSGGNTGDACSLFDTDTDSKVNFAVCVTIGGAPAAQLTGSPRVYTCGDGKVDRCTSTYTEVPAAQVDTACGVNVNANDPFHGGQKDAQAICHIDLGDVGGVGTANLVNTCSYPSREPTSAPADCVLIPRDAFLKIVKVADPANAGTFPFTLGLTTDAAPPVVFTATGSQSSAFIAIRSDRAYKVTENKPAGWDLQSASCTGASGTGSSNGSLTGTTISGIDASPDNQVVCTFTNKRQTSNVKVVKTDDTGRILNGATFSLYTDNAPTGGSPGAEDNGAGINPVGTCVTANDGTCTISNVALGAYWLIETGVPAGHTGADPQTVTLQNGGVTVTKSFINPRGKGSIAITKTDDGNNLLDMVRFTLVGTSMFGDAVSLGCTTGLTGTCTISNIPLGTYTLDEDESTIMPGFTKASNMPQQVTVSTNGQTVPVAVVNPRAHRVITIVCHEGTIDLDATDVTQEGGSTKTSISGVPAALAAKGVTKADLCAIGGATFGGLDHTDTDFTVELSE